MFLTNSNTKSTEKLAKPFLKWAGGKAQLIPQLEFHFPQMLTDGLIDNYIEPFVGSGAVFFHLINKYKIKNIFIFDLNPELVIAYKTIQDDVENLINALSMLNSDYEKLNTSEQEKYFYNIRSLFNKEKSLTNYTEFNQMWISRSAQFLFLNRTCFNGLFRVNSRGEFNVPFGKYKNPAILNSVNLLNVSSVLKRVQIEHGDFEKCESFVNSKSFVYFDPPYRPLSQTSNFTSYLSANFDDKTQIRLAEFFRVLDKKGAKLMLSNSDPKNENPEDNFIENLYKGFRIERVKANRMINSVASKRGQINEVLVINY